MSPKILLDRRLVIVGAGVVGRALGKTLRDAGLPVAAIISRSCDGVAIVVKENGVSRRELAEARGQFEKVGGRVIGAVLNDVEFNHRGMKKYYYKSYYKYDSSNYGYYGASGDAGRRK